MPKVDPTGQLQMLLVTTSAAPDAAGSGSTTVAKVSVLSVQTQLPTVAL